MFLNNYQAVCLAPLPTVKMPDIISSIAAETPGPTPGLSFPLCGTFPSSPRRPRGENRAGRQEFKLWTIHFISLFFVHKISVTLWPYFTGSQRDCIYQCSLMLGKNLEIRNPNLYHILISYLFSRRPPPPTNLKPGAVLNVCGTHSTKYARIKGLMLSCLEWVRVATILKA